MNNSKFCFIMCSNNKQYEEECMLYINNLKIPDGYSVEHIIIHNAASMTSGYNKAMHSSDAKYKIYLHQDVFIINKNFLYDLLTYFKAPSVGMIGIVGSPDFPKNCVMWYCYRIGIFYSNSIYSSSYNEFQKIYTPTQVEAIDGFLMATQYDILWREDIFTGWDFYDISQSFEFRKAGYNIIIPPSDTPWCFHDDGILNLTDYNNNRKLFREYYSSML
jgi:hypothetical protein